MRPLAFLVGFLVAGCAPSPGPKVSSEAPSLPQKAPGLYVETVGGRTYRLIVPKAYDATRRLPLMVLLHGWTGNATQVIGYTGMAAKAEAEGFVLVAPEGVGKPQGWNVGFLDLSGQNHPDDVGFVGNVMDQVEKEVGIDPARVYAVGHSNGAMLAHLVGAKFADRIAAIGAVAGTVGLPAHGRQGEVTIPTPSTPVSAILLHGTADMLVSYDNAHPGLLNGISAPSSARWWAVQDGCGTTPTHTVSAGGKESVDDFATGRNGTEVKLVTYTEGTHDWPRDATSLIWDFLAAHPKTGGS